MRWPVAANTALATAGASGGVPGSPTPPHSWEYLFSGREEIRLDLGHLVHAQSAIVVEVGLLNLPLVQCDLSVKHRTQSIDDGALHLGFDNTWIDDIAGVDHAYHAVYCEFTRFAHGDIHDLRGDGVVAFGERNALGDSLWSMAPTCAACCFIQDGQRARPFESSPRRKR